ncbi:MAG: hypothetical protein AAFX58_07150 [Pseudomonadota bacterium]
MLRQRILTTVVIAAALCACAPPANDNEPATFPVDADAGNAGQRSALTPAQCNEQGGRIVGDIGDGRIHRPDYRCDSGDPPLGVIRYDGSGPRPIEGAVCCGSESPQR